MPGLKKELLWPVKKLIKSNMSLKSSRRDFLKQSWVLGSGLAIGFSPVAANTLVGRAELEKFELTPFIIICSDGKITLVNNSPDMGQGSIQALPILIAEELEVDLQQVNIIQSNGDARYGSQISGGSGGVVRAWEPLRKAGAAAREMLISAAAQTWNTSIENCKAEKGQVINGLTKEKLSYGKLVKTASHYDVPQNPVLKKRSEFRLIGKTTKRPDIYDRVTGKAVYGIDVDVPGMVYASILHCPSLYSKIKSIDDSKVRELNGVLDIMKCERTMPYRKMEAVAVLASNFWIAMQGRKLLNVTWEDAPGKKDAPDQIDSADYVKRMYAAAKEPGPVHAEKGNFDQAYTQSHKKIESVYESNFLAHAPMEPENTVAHVKDDGTVEVWVPYQSPEWAKTEVAKYLDIPPEKVKVNVTLLGGSFGRKSYSDFLLEACFLSRKIKKPVKLIWSREDDITQGPFRPAMLSRLQGIGTGKKMTGMHHHAIGETFAAQIYGALKPREPDAGLCGEIIFDNAKYNFETSKITHTRVSTDIPIMWWRSVWGGNFAWSQECFVDELAHALKADPLQLRLDSLDDERYWHVLSLLAEKSSYHQPSPVGEARGIAMWKSFGSISAACVTVTRQNAKIQIKKVVSVLDCGLFVNEDMVKAQMEGCIIMGISAATKEDISFNNGKCDQTNFHQYKILRLNELPEIETYIIANETSPGGVGEPGLPPIAPALGNAIFNLTGKRIRKLPISLDEV
jgi:isoquinoline 1-oxidoreductase beta subunit